MQVCILHGSKTLMSYLKPLLSNRHGRGQDQGVIAAQMAKPICFKVLENIAVLLFPKNCEYFPNLHL